MDKYKGIAKVLVLELFGMNAGVVVTLIAKS